MLRTGRWKSSPARTGPGSERLNPGPFALCMRKVEKVNGKWQKAEGSGRACHSDGSERCARRTDNGSASRDTQHSERTQRTRWVEAGGWTHRGRERAERGEQPAVGAPRSAVLDGGGEQQQVAASAKQLDLRSDSAGCVSPLEA